MPVVNILSPIRDQIVYAENGWQLMYAEKSALSNAEKSTLRREGRLCMQNKKHAEGWQIAVVDAEKSALSDANKSTLSMDGRRMGMKYSARIIYIRVRRQMKRTLRM